MYDLLNPQVFLLLCLVFARVSGFIMLNPVFGRMTIPNMIKVLISMSLTMVLFTEAHLGTQAETYGSLGFAALMLKEFAVGYIISFVMRLYEFVVVYAGGIIDYEMGLSMSAIYDMQHGQQIPLSGNLIQIFYYLIFFAVDGHLAIIKIFNDFSSINGYGSLKFGTDVYTAMLDLFLNCVVLAVKFAMPVIVLQLLIEMAEGILMKVLPSINVFVVNLQMKIIIGLLILFFLTSPIYENLNRLILDVSDSIIRVLKLMGT